MDLLDSILGSMDKPPSMSEKEKGKCGATHIQTNFGGIVWALESF